MGCVRGFPRKTPGKSRENCWKIFPESRNATNSRTSGTGKGKPAGNLGSTLPETLSLPSGGGIFWNRQFQPSRVFLRTRKRLELYFSLKYATARGHLRKMRGVAARGGVPECTKIAHRHSLAIFHCRLNPKDPVILKILLGHGEVRVYRGTGVSRGVQRTTWERSLKIWELQIPCFKEFSCGGNTLGLVPSCRPHSLGYACTLYAPTSPPLKNTTVILIRMRLFCLQFEASCLQWSFFTYSWQF